MITAAAAPARSGPTLLVLFDIDGTLLSCGAQAGRLLLAVLEEVFGRPGNPDRLAFAGKTDSRIVIELMSAVGVPRDEIETRLPDVRDRYLARLDAALDIRRMRLLAGVGTLLEALAQSPGVELGLVTGNWEGGARTKLSRFDLNGYFSFGAFGDDGIDRHQLPPIALERARQVTGHEFAAGQVWIVGDTPHDVSCGRHHGHRVLAVATGHWSVEQLLAEGADRVVSGLDGDTALGVLLEAAGR